MTRPSRGKMFVGGQQRLHQNFVGRFINRVETVGGGFVRTEHAEVFGVLVQSHHITQKFSEFASRFGKGSSRLHHLHRVVAKIRHDQVFQQQAAIRVGVRAHSARRPSGASSASSGMNFPL